MPITLTCSLFLGGTLGSISESLSPVPSSYYIGATQVKFLCLLSFYSGLCIISFSSGTWFSNYAARLLASLLADPLPIYYLLLILTLADYCLSYLFIRFEVNSTFGLNPCFGVGYSCSDSVVTPGFTCGGNLDHDFVSLDTCSSNSETCCISTLHSLTTNVSSEGTAIISLDIVFI